MKTLLESIINELRLSKASTGRKLENKTFGELIKGDYVFKSNYSYSAKALTIDIFRIEKVESNVIGGVTFVIDDENKKKKYDTTFYCINVDNGYGMEIVGIKDAHYISLVPGIKNGHIFASTTALMDFMSTYNIDLDEPSTQSLNKLGLL